MEGRAMTRKDYELVARVIDQFGYIIHKEELVEALIDAFHADNARFKDNRFRKAAGTEVLVS